MLQINKIKMKKLTLLKATMLLTIFVTCISLIVSCGYNQKQEENNDVAEERYSTEPNNSNYIAEERFDIKSDDSNQEKDVQFLVNAAETNLKEIHLGQLAQQKGNATHVKELGKMMEIAHTKSFNDLTALAESKMINIPSAPNKKAEDDYKRLSEKSANDFDKMYADMMVNGHKDTIATFEKASKDSDDADIKNWAMVSLPNLHINLDRSMVSQRECNKNMAIKTD